MKKLLFFLALAAIVASCKSNEPKAFTIDPMATINIKPDANSFKSPAMKVKSDVEHLSALEIVKQTDMIRMTMKDGRLAERGFDVAQRDTTASNPMLKMWGTDIMYYDQLIDGTYTDDLILVPDFLEAKNCLLITIKGDTIAYIPNSILRSAETQIKSLFEAKDYEPIYTLFNNAYTFTPITGAEYRSLNQE